MRKGVNDLHRCCRVSDKCNECYADAMASAQVEEKLKEVASLACNRIKKDGKIY
jgi:protein gp37